MGIHERFVAARTDTDQIEMWRLFVVNIRLEEQVGSIPERAEPHNVKR